MMMGLHASLVLLNLFHCHALQSLCSVFVHVYGELVHEILGLDVASILVQNVTIRL